MIMSFCIQMMVVVILSVGVAILVAVLSVGVAVGVVMGMVVGMVVSCRRQAVVGVGVTIVQVANRILTLTTRIWHTVKGTGENGDSVV